MALGRRFQQHQAGYAATGVDMLHSLGGVFGIDEAARETDQSLACHWTGAQSVCTLSGVEDCRWAGRNALAVRQRRGQLHCHNAAHVVLLPSLSLTPSPPLTLKRSQVQNIHLDSRRWGVLDVAV